MLSILLDRTENWTLKKEDENRLLFFEMTCQRKIMGVSKLETQLKIRQLLGLNYAVIDRVTQKKIDWKAEDQRLDLPKDGRAA